jgi:hypothetical protein
MTFQTITYQADPYAWYGESIDKRMQASIYHAGNKIQLHLTVTNNGDKVQITMAFDTILTAFQSLNTWRSLLDV